MRLSELIVRRHHVAAVGDAIEQIQLFTIRGFPMGILEVATAVIDC